MGNSAGNELDDGYKELILDEFAAVKKDSLREHLVLSEVVKITPPDDYNVKIGHIGNLFVLDRQKDGRFTIEDLFKFGEYCRDESSKFKGYEFTFQLQAQSTLLMWKELQAGAPEDFSGWVGRLLYENSPVQYFAVAPGVPFVNIESAKLLYDVMDMKMLKGFSLQDFFNLLQQAAEENRLMPLECKDLDNYVPLSVCQEFSNDFLIGFSRLFKEIGLHKSS